VKNIKKFIKHICASSYVELLEKFNYIKHDNPIICKIWSTDDGTFYKTDRILEKLGNDNKSNIIMRTRIASNIMLNRGFPKEEGPHQVVLIPLPSFIKSIGVKKFNKFLKDWRGSSKVNEVEVIRYSVLM